MASSLALSFFRSSTASARDLVSISFKPSDNMSIATRASKQQPPEIMDYKLSLLFLFKLQPCVIQQRNEKEMGKLAIQILLTVIPFLMQPQRSSPKYEFLNPREGIKVLSDAACDADWIRQLIDD